MLLEEMTFEDVENYFKDHDMVILPCGSTEQHGHHMVLGTDFIIAKEFAQRISERTDVLVAPTVNYGYTQYHINGYKGTIGFDQDLLYEVYFTICKRLIDMGAKKIVFMNGHGGNSYVLKRVSMNLWYQYKVMGLILDWWSIAGMIKPEWEELGHAGKPETAAMMYLFPQYVHTDKIQFSGYKTLAEGVETLGSATFMYDGIKYGIWLDTEDVTDSGNYGEDPKLATVEMGHDSVEAVIDKVSDFIVNKFTKMKVPGKN